MAQTCSYSNVNICRRRPSGFRETKLCLLCHGALTQHVEGKSSRRSLVYDTKSRGRLLCQGQGNELVVNRRQIVAASGWTQNARGWLHPMIRHSLLLSGPSFSVESTDSRWTIRRGHSRARLRRKCPTVPQQRHEKTPERFREKWSRLAVMMVGKKNSITSSRR